MSEKRYALYRVYDDNSTGLLNDYHSVGAAISRAVRINPRAIATGRTTLGDLTLEIPSMYLAGFGQRKVMFIIRETLGTPPDKIDLPPLSNTP